ncbi:MAG: HEAT repeat domain-containing protein [Rhodothermaceae bacterium]|nr:HEAT repeat domain-containing protein [Rhodothermaceae bacterium]
MTQYTNPLLVKRKRSLVGILVLGVALLATACSGSRKAAEPPPVVEEAVEQEPQVSLPPPAPVVDVEEEDPDPRILYDDRIGFREPQSNVDVSNTILDISFDFPRQRVNGVAIHQMEVMSDLLGTLSMDGRDMDIHSVSLKRAGTGFENNPFVYENHDIRIPISPQAKKGDRIEVRIEYTAHPYRNGQKLGLAFIDPQGIDDSRPTQVWTLGQPEDNQYWFPSWDYPNDRMTFDISLTVPERFTTAANGQLISRDLVGNGLRKDRWVLSKPHVSYLTGFAVGEYTVVADAYTRPDGTQVPLAYFVEPEHALNAMLVFGETSRIIGYFEQKLGIAYPWENYKQIAVRDFTARGMENTSATIMYDDLQRDERAHMDESGLDLIVHELAHQWFGNLLTCRNWAHLPLNEGFATYFERVYMEEARGMDAAQYHTIMDREKYFESAKTLQRPIIWYGYDDPNVLYDRHTYEKSALVLHQLRYELGEDVWWRGVRNFVRDNAFEEVVVEDLQQAMQEASGRPLGNFFDQWYRRPGHPELEVTHSFEQDRGLYGVRVKQVQDSLTVGTFAFSVGVEVNMTGFSPFTQKFRVVNRDTTFQFAIASALDFVQFDAGDWLLAEIHVEKETNEWISQARLDNEMAGRLEAVKALGEKETEGKIQDELLIIAQSDTSPYVRAGAVEALKGYGEDETVRNGLLARVRTDTSPLVRQAAMDALSVVNDVLLKEALDTGVQDQSYAVVTRAVELYADSFPNEFVVGVRPLFNLSSWNQVVERALLEEYGVVKSLEGIPYLQKFLSSRYNEDLQSTALQSLSSIAATHPEVKSSIYDAIVPSLDSIHESVRYAAAVALKPFRGEQLRALATQKVQGEQSERVRGAMRELLN